MQMPKVPLPFYFGAADQPLFGCYHEPEAGRCRRCAVVICQPIGHEYINCHRALRQLAVRMCEAGFPVLRFDYYSCGDSYGDSKAGTIPQWLQDISTALDEVKRRSNLDKLCIVGLRFGGALSAMTGAQRGDIESMVLWDPVGDGKSYLRELSLLQKEQMRFRPKPRRTKVSQEVIEILGFPFTRELYGQMEQVNLSAITSPPAKKMLVIQSRPSDKHPDNDLFDSSEIQLERRMLEIPQIWLPTENGSLLVPGQAVQSIVSWTGRMHS